MEKFIGEEKRKNIYHVFLFHRQCEIPCLQAITSDKEKKAVSTVVRKAVEKQLKMVNVIVNRSISFRSVDEQRDFYVDMCEYVNDHVCEL